MHESDRPIRYVLEDSDGGLLCGLCSPRRRAATSPSGTVTAGGGAHLAIPAASETARTGSSLQDMGRTGGKRKHWCALCACVHYLTNHQWRLLSKVDGLWTVCGRAIPRIVAAMLDVEKHYTSGDKGKVYVCRTRGDDLVGLRAEDDATRGAGHKAKTLSEVVLGQVCALLGRLDDDDLDEVARAHFHAAASGAAEGAADGAGAESAGGAGESEGDAGGACVATPGGRDPAAGGGRRGRPRNASSTFHHAALSGKHKYEWDRTLEKRTAEIAKLTGEDVKGQVLYICDHMPEVLGVVKTAFGLVEAEADVDEVRADRVSGRGPTAASAAFLKAKLGLSREAYRCLTRVAGNGAVAWPTWADVQAYEEEMALVGTTRLEGVDAPHAVVTNVGEVVSSRLKFLDEAGVAAAGRPREDISSLELAIGGDG